jgi:hypothetical protein
MRGVDYAFGGRESEGGDGGGESDEDSAMVIKCV